MWLCWLGFSQLNVGCSTLMGGGKQPVDDSPQQVLYQMGATVPEYSQISTEQWSRWALAAEASVDKVYALLVLNRPAQALVTARQYIAENPGDLDGFEALVCVLYAQKSLALLRYHARHVLALDPQRTQMWNMIGLAHVYTARTLADFRAAESFFKKAATHPDSAAAAWRWEPLSEPSRCFCRLMRLAQVVLPPSWEWGSR